MAQPPDIADLAKRYVALWQDYLTATASDPVLADALARMLAGAGALASPWLRQAAAAAQQGTRPAPPPSPPHDNATSEGENAAAASRPAPAAAASDERGDQLAQLGRRIARIEERLAALETGARERGARARGAPRRRRS